MLFDKLVKEYSNSLNINQLSFDTYDNKSGQFYIVPKPNSTVYANSTLTVQINVSNSAVLTYGVTTLTTGTNSGAGTFNYRGQVKSPTYSIVSPNDSLVKINSTTGVVTFSTTSNFDGGIAVVTASYTDPSTSVTYSAQ
jgi:hypothetical protein